MVWLASYSLARPRAEATRPDERPGQTRKRGPGTKASKRGNAASRRPQTAQKRSHLGAVNGASEFCKKNLWPNFGKATDRGRRSLGQGLGKPDKRPKRGPGAKIPKRRNAAARRAKNGPKTDQQRSHLGAANGASEFCKKKHLAGARHLMLSCHAQHVVPA